MLTVLATHDFQGGPGRPMILLHGFTGDASTWSPLLPEIGRQRLLGIDLVGHGDSEAPGDPEAYTMPATLRSILAALDEAAIDGPVHWLGYSMGGRVALSLAAGHPERVASLSLIGTSPGLSKPAERAARVAADAALADFIEREGLEAFVDRWMQHPLFASQARLGPEFLARARAQRLQNRPHALAQTLRQLGTGSMPPLWDALPALRMPALLIAGGLDLKFRALASEMAGKMPNATLLVVPGAGHAVQVEAPASLARALEAFIDRVDGGRPGIEPSRGPM